MPRIGKQSSVPFTLEGTESHILHAATIGDDYQIDIAVPAGPPPADGWPVAYLLDAKGCFATCVEALKRMARRPDATGVRPMVVIGISSASHEQGNRTRQRDFAGKGAVDFLSFLQSEVRTLVAEKVRLDPKQQTLFGHSLAGSFALWVLANQPQAFRSYAAISPSIWSNKIGLVGSIENARGTDRRAMVLVGEWEDELPTWQQASPGSEQVRARRAERRMVVTAREFADLLAEVLGKDQCSFRLLSEEDHASIISAAIPRMLRLASLP